MVAYNFKTAFHEPIRKGAKRQTVRHAGKKRHARPGELVQLYKGLRTKAAEKLIPDPTCIALDHIVIVIDVESPGGVGRIDINGVPLTRPEMTDFAIADGFSDLTQFGRFWRVTHGPGRFDGVVVRWR